MATIEVDEAAFLKNQQLAGLVNKMLATPGSRRRVLEAHKIVDPNVVIPELDAAKPVEDAVTAMNKRMEDFMAAQEKQRADDKAEKAKNEFVTKFESGRAHLRSEYGVTDEGLKKVEDLMTQAGIVDHEIGYAAFSKLNPEPEPAPPAPNSGFRGLFGDVSKNPDEFIKSMHASKGNDEGALDKHIHDILQDVRASSGVPAQRAQFGGRR